MIWRCHLLKAVVAARWQARRARRRHIPGPVYFDGGAWGSSRGVPAYDWAVKQIPIDRMGAPRSGASWPSSPAGGFLITGSNIVADSSFTKRVQF
jgi:hypothetical protein